MIPDWPPLRQSGLAVARIPLPERAPVRHVGLVWGEQGPRVKLARAFLDEAVVVFRDPVAATNATLAKQRARRRPTA